jgi:hypothetical protein
LSQFFNLCNLLSMHFVQDFVFFLHAQTVNSAYTFYTLGISNILSHFIH